MPINPFTPHWTKYCTHHEEPIHKSERKSRKPIRTKPYQHTNHRGGTNTQLMEREREREREDLPLQSTALGLPSELEIQIIHAPIPLAIELPLYEWAFLRLVQRICLIPNPYPLKKITLLPTPNRISNTDNNNNKNEQNTLNPWTHFSISSSPRERNRDGFCVEFYSSKDPFPISHVSRFPFNI